MHRDSHWQPQLGFRRPPDARAAWQWRWFWGESNLSNCVASRHQISPAKGQGFVEQGQVTLVWIPWSMNRLYFLTLERHLMCLEQTLYKKHEHFFCLFCFTNGYFAFFNFYFLSFLEDNCCCCCSITQSCPTFCYPMDCTMPSFSVLHHLSEISQTHIHWERNAIQPPHPLSSPSLPALSLFQHQGLFQWGGSLHQVAKVLELQLQHKFFQWIFRTDFL